MNLGLLSQEPDDPAQEEERLPVRTEADVVKVRQAVRRWTERLRMSLTDQTKVVTAASELARNTVIHAGGGDLTISLVERGRSRGLRLVFEDQGPGISDPDLAMRDGFTTGSGLGLGLGGAKRLMSDLEVTAREGGGTRVVATKWTQ